MSNLHKYWLYFLLITSISTMVLIFLKFPLNHHFKHDTPIIYPTHNYPIPNCNPLIISNTTTNQQYYVIIDGRQYPTPNSTALQLLKHSLNFTCLNLNANVKRILAWNPFFGDYGYGMGIGWRQPFVERGCPVVNCELVSSQDNRQPLDHFHLVLVHMRDSFRPIPKVRPAKQKWVFVLYESPANSAEGRDFDELDGIFNATSTYTHDSDFSCNKDVFEWTRSFNRFNEEAVEKREMAAAALISNCGASSRRIEYIREMQKYIRVDVFGGCGKECPKIVGNARDCMEVLSRKYKFYLAFENSICRDYITEKFFRQLNHYIIPVTLGGGPYHIYVPKSGYIDALDFATPKSLASYLNYLLSNKTAYDSYFEWRKHVIYRERSNTIPFCDMCIRMHLDDFFGIETKVIEKIGEYWSKELNCKNLLNKDLNKLDYRSLKINN